MATVRALDARIEGQEVDGPCSHHGWFQDAVKMLLVKIARLSHSHPVSAPQANGWWQVESFVVRAARSERLDWLYPDFGTRHQLSDLQLSVNF